MRKSTNYKYWYYLSVGDRIVVPKDIDIPISVTYECFPFWQKSLSDVINGTESEMGRLSRIIQGAQSNHINPSNERKFPGSSQWKRCEHGKGHRLYCWFWRWRKGLWTKEWKQIPEAEKAKETDSHLALPEGTSSHTLILTQWYWLWISDIQNYKIIYLVLYKLPNLW